MQANETDLDLAVNDLGPLAWVLDELRKSLDSASGALRRFVRDAGLARGTDMASVDTGQLRIARQQLHQAVGALEMVGLGAPAYMLRAMESAVQKFVERPELCSEASAAKVERAGFALTEYLEGVLHGKAVSAVALFPQYRDVQELAGAERVHPADLWALDWRWTEPETPPADRTLDYSPSVRSRLDQAVLRIVKSADPKAAHDLSQACLGLAAGQQARQPRIFWKICAAYFEAMSLSLLPADVYVKRAASRVLMQYASLAKGELGVSDRLAQDLVFFCSLAVPAQPAQAPSLAAVRQAWGLARFKPVDYQAAQYGRFDPTLVAQARRRISAAKESWSGLSGGDLNKLKGVHDQFNLVCDSLNKLHPPSAPLGQALAAAIDGVVRSSQAPRAELAMEVATAVLYLEAAFEDLDPTDSQLTARTLRLAQRLEGVRQGGQPDPLEGWMEELYRRVSDRQTMGSVVGELRTNLSELEKLLDVFFRDPKDKGPLKTVPGQLAQMRGVLSVLGLDQAAQAVLRMKGAVEEIMVTEIDEERARAAGTFEKLGNNLGALGFLIDMLNYQPSLAKKLFLYNDATGELRPLMGRSVDAPAPAPAEPAQYEATQAIAVPVVPPSEQTVRLDMASMPQHMATVPLRAPAPAAPAAAPAAPAATPAPVVAAPAAPAQDDEEDGELLEIFLEEAREVVGNGLAAVSALAAQPSDMSELTTLRRAFHTLKGSSRMVGLNEFGEAGWALEQVLNTWLADQKPANEALLNLSGTAMRGFGRWIDDIAAKQAGAWKSSMFRGPADAFRTEGRILPWALPEAGAAEPAPAVPGPAAAPVFESVEPTVALHRSAPQPPEPAPPAVAPAADLPAFDLALDVPAPVAAPEPAPVAAPEPAPTPALEAFAPPELAADEALAFFDLAPGAQAPTAPPPASDAAPAQVEDFTFDLPVSAAEPSEPLPESLGATLVIRDEVPAAAEVPADELPADFAFHPDLPEATPAPVVAVEAPSPIEGIDFASLAAVSGALAPDEVAAQAPVPLDAPAPAPADAVAAMVLPEAEPEPGSEPAFEEQVKVIGDLRIGIPLYNVYLNEADEWSRRLATEVSEWALELNRPVSDSTVGLAHALGGSSATVGFLGLSEIARALEQALEEARPLGYGLPQHGAAFVNAAEEIRRLLHQFAAGFLKEPDPSVLQALMDLRSLDLTPRTDDGTAGGIAAPFEFEFEPPDAAPPPAAAAPFTPFAPAAPDPVPVPEPMPEPAFAAEALAVPQAMVQVTPPRAAQNPAEAPLSLSVGLGDADDDFDIEDAVDLDLFPIFEEEAADLMPQLGASLREWSARPGDRVPRDEVLRVLHTLKGSARLAGALRLGEMAHRMESEIEQIASESATAGDVEPLLARFDNMQARFDQLRESGGQMPAAAQASGTAMAPPAAEFEPDVPAPSKDFEAPEVAPAPAPSSKAAATPIDFSAAASAEPPAPAPAEAAASGRALARPVATQMAPQRAAANQAVRVRAQLLDRLVNQAGEVIITRSRLEAELRLLRSSLGDLTDNLDRLRSQLRDIELQAESQMQSRLAQAKDSAAGFDPLEFDRFTRVQELTRMMAESVNDVATVQRTLQRTVEATEDDLIAQARQTRELQRDLLRTRMVEFEAISDRLYRVVRLASKETGKQVKLDITGGSIEMDRGVLDRMTPAFEHLLRNCVAHGVEDPATRAAAGKDPSGNIVVDLHYEGNDVSVAFRDDGAGLNLPRIREKALQQGLITPDQPLSEAEAANLIFMPGFSTATQVTELAGRGIGMDVVRSEVNALGGRIETSTVPGRGTTFKLVLPLTTAVTQVVMVRSGQLSVGVPANLIEVVRRATAREIEQAYNSGTYEVGGEQVPFFWSGALLQSSSRSNEPQARTLPVVVFRSAAQRVAVHVDEVLGNQEVVVKNLGPQLARLPGLAGMTMLASGAVVLIYNPVALASVYGEQARRLSADHAQPEVLEQAAAGTPVAPALPEAPPQIPLVLVVDDSITVRRVTQRLLAREGYRVALAADGLQALERLAEEKPAVVLSDIEMPRMDGFDLARNIRADQKLAGLPIIMITSRIAEKHRDHAMELGVNHYLGKPYSEEELLSLVRHYCAALLPA